MLPLSQVGAQLRGRNTLVSWEIRLKRVSLVLERKVLNYVWFCSKLSLFFFV